MEYQCIVMCGDFGFWVAPDLRHLLEEARGEKRSEIENNRFDILTAMHAGHSFIMMNECRYRYVHIVRNELQLKPTIQHVKYHLPSQ